MTGERSLGLLVNIALVLSPFASVFALILQLFFVPLSLRRKFLLGIGWDNINSTAITS
jgi:hypothetical protein